MIFSVHSITLGHMQLRRRLHTSILRALNRPDCNTAVAPSLSVESGKLKDLTNDGGLIVFQTASMRSGVAAKPSAQTRRNS